MLKLNVKSLLDKQVGHLRVLSISGNAFKVNPLSATFDL